jgi:hypothetical protein
MEKLALSVISITVSGKLVAKRMKLLLARLSPVLVTT